MTHYRRGDIVLLPFPFTDLTTTKQRPALIISRDDFNRRGEDVVACAITSKDPQVISDFDILLHPDDLRQAGLPKPSKIKCGKIVTIDSRLIRKKLGNLPFSRMIAVQKIISDIISPD